MTDHFKYLSRCYCLALRGRGRTSPNPMVGAVIVNKNRVIAEGWHKKCGGPHAEVMALRSAGSRAKGATMVVTLEPCSHHGRTPPCVDAIIQSGITRVVMAMRDPNPLTKGKSLRKLKRAGIQVVLFNPQRPCEEDLLEDMMVMNEPFVKYITQKAPFVVAKTAQTLDGKIATAQGQSQWITSWATRQFSRRLRNDFDAILVGVRTILKDNPQLNASRKTKALKKVVLDSTLKMPLHAKLFKGVHPSDCIVVATSKAPKRRMAAFEKKGVQVWVAPVKKGKISLSWVMKRLAREEIIHVLIEGGAQVIGSAFQEKIVDKVHVYVAPKIAGDETALDAVVGRRMSHMHQAISLKDVVVHNVGQDIFVQGYVI